MNIRFLGIWPPITCSLLPRIYSLLPKKKIRYPQITFPFVHFREQLATIWCYQARYRKQGYHLQYRLQRGWTDWVLTYLEPWQHTRKTLKPKPITIQRSLFRLRSVNLSWRVMDNLDPILLSSSLFSVSDRCWRNIHLFTHENDENSEEKLKGQTNSGSGGYSLLFRHNYSRQSQVILYERLGFLYSTGK